MIASLDKNTLIRICVDGYRRNRPVLEGNDDDDDDALIGDILLLMSLIFLLPSLNYRYTNLIARHISGKYLFNKFNKTPGILPDA